MKRAVVLALVGILVAAQAAACEPSLARKRVTRYFDVSPTGEVRGAVTVKLEVEGVSGEFSDAVLLAVPGTVSVVGDAPPPAEVSAEGPLCVIRWRGLRGSRVALHYCAEASARFVEGLCRIYVSSEERELERLAGAYVVRASKGDSIVVEYVLRNVAPIYVTANGSLVRAVLPLLATIGLDEARVLVEGANPRPNATAKVAGGRIMTWFLLLRDEAVIRLRLRLRKLGPWREVRIGPLVVRVDFNVRDRLAKVDSMLSELREELERVERAEAELSRMLGLYARYAEALSNYTRWASEVGDLLRYNASSAFRLQADLLSRYASQLEEVAVSVARAEAQAHAVLRALRRVRDALANSTVSEEQLLDRLEEVLDVVEEYNVSSAVVEELVALVRSAVISVNSSGELRSVLVSLTDRLIGAVESGAGRLGEFREPIELLASGLSSYSRTQARLSEHLRELGDQLLVVSEQLNASLAEARSAVERYSGMLSELRKGAERVRREIAELRSVKLGLLALALFAAAESPAPEANVRVSGNASAVVLELRGRVELPEQVSEDVEVVIESFHVTDLDESLLTAHAAKQPGRPRSDEGAALALLGVAAASLCSLALAAAAKRKRKPPSELIEQVDELIKRVVEELEGRRCSGG